MAFDRQQAIQDVAKQLYGYAVSLCADATLAEDLTQEAIARAIAASRAPDERSAFRAWLFRILRNAFIDHTRRNGRLVALDSDDLDDESDRRHTGGPSLFNDRMIDALTVRVAFERLQATQREIIGLVDIVGFSYGEAAEMLDIPIGTVMSP
jgi:RNA polymerase sigma-70 factor (ECF subfamily)